MSLHEKLKAIRDRSAEKIPAPSKEIMRRAIQDLKDSDQIEGAIAEGVSARDFTLFDHKGTEWSLTENLANGPVVVSFIRGHW